MVTTHGYCCCRSHDHGEMDTSVSEPGLLVMLLSGYWDIHLKNVECFPTPLHSLVLK